MSSMSRRAAFGALAATPLAASPLAAPALAQSATVVWRMATSWPSRLPILPESAAAFARIVAQASAGRMAIEIVDPAVHKAPGGILDLVRKGEFELGHSTAHYYRQAIPAIDFFTATPFGMNASENYAWLYAGGGEDLMREIFAAHGIVALPAGNTGAQMGGWFKREIGSVADIKGVRLRVSGQPGLVWNALGGTAVAMPGGAIPQGFAEDKIDAAEFVGPAIDLALDLPKYASFYYGVWHEPNVELHLFIDRARFEALPGDLQAAVRVAARAAAAETLAISIARNALAWDAARGRSDIKLRTWPPEVLAAMRRANEDVLADLLARDADSRRDVDSQRAFQAKTRAYFAMTEIPALRSE